MSGIKRWYYSELYNEIRQEDHGKYVLHSDHEAEVARLRAELDRAHEFYQDQVGSQAVGIKEWLEAASRSAVSRMDALMKALRAYGAASMTIGGSPLSKRDYYEAQTRRDLAWNEVKAIAESMAEDLQISRTAQAVAHDPSVDSQAVGK